MAAMFPVRRGVAGAGGKSAFTAERLVCVLRPEGTTLWLPVALAGSLGLGRGDRMSAAQFADGRVQGLIERRLGSQLGRTGR